MDGIDFSDPNIVKIVDAIGADSICENFGALVDCNSFLAPLLVTGMTNLLMTGVILSQAFTYSWLHYCRDLDRPATLGLAWMSTVLQVTSGIADFVKMVSIYGLHFGQYHSFIVPHRMDALSQVSLSLCQSITQCFLLYKAWRFSTLSVTGSSSLGSGSGFGASLSGARFGPGLMGTHSKALVVRVVCIALLALIVVSFAAGMIVTLEQQIINNWIILALRTARTRLYDSAMPVWLASSTFVDITLAVVLFWELYLPKKERSDKFNALHERVIKFLLVIMQSGTTLAALQLALLIAWQYQLMLGNPLKWTSWIYLPQLVLGKYYTITLLLVITVPHTSRRRRRSTSGRMGSSSLAVDLDLGRVSAGGGVVPAYTNKPTFGRAGSGRVRITGQRRGSDEDDDTELSSFKSISRGSRVVHNASFDEMVHAEKQAHHLGQDHVVPRIHIKEASPRSQRFFPPSRLVCASRSLSPTSSRPTNFIDSCDTTSNTNSRVVNRPISRSRNCSDHHHPRFSSTNSQQSCHVQEHPTSPTHSQAIQTEYTNCLIRQEFFRMLESPQERSREIDLGERLVRVAEESSNIGSGGDAGRRLADKDKDKMPSDAARSRIMSAECDNTTGNSIGYLLGRVRRRSDPTMTISTGSVDEEARLSRSSTTTVHAFADAGERGTSAQQARKPFYVSEAEDDRLGPTYSSSLSQHPTSNTARRSTPSFTQESGSHPSENHAPNLLLHGEKTDPTQHRGFLPTQNSNASSVHSHTLGLSASSAHCADSLCSTDDSYGRAINDEEAEVWKQADTRLTSPPPMGLSDDKPSKAIHHANDGHHADDGPALASQTSGAPRG